jgi:hypothetical protein
MWPRWDSNWQFYMRQAKLDRLGLLFGLGAYLLLLTLTLLSVFRVIEPRVELHGRGGAVTTDAELLVLLVAPLPLLIGIWIWKLVKRRKQRDELIP